MNNPDLKKRLIHLAAILFSTLLLCVIAFYNTFPLTFNNDTGIYINSGFTGEVQEERPIIYGFFLALVSLNYSLWLVVVTQALIVALIIYYIFRYTSKAEKFIWFYLGFVALVTFFMGTGFEVGWLMPDVFTATTILCAVLIIFCNNLKWRDIIIISAIIVISITVHNTHFYIAILLCCVVLAGYLLKSVRRIYGAVEIRFKKIVLVIALAVLSNLVSATIHHQNGGAFKSSHGGIIFFMSNLVEMGVIDPYLAESCGKKNYILCAYRDSIPNNFLWARNSPLKKTGGWVTNEPEYLAIEKDLLTRPKYLFKIVYKSALYTLKQFFNYDIVHVRRPTEFVGNSISVHFPHEYKSYMNSLQYTGRMSFEFINYTQNILVAICLFFYGVVLTSKKTTLKERIIMLFLLTGIVLNAWVCSTFSGVYPRYQTRVVWILPLPLFIYCLENLRFKTGFKM